MTYHFVNLVSLSWFLNRDLYLSRLYCDGFSLALLARLKGIRLKQISGPSMADSILKLPSLIILGSTESDEHHYELPFWNNLNEVYLTEEIISRIKAHDNIIIAISSPKQDKLALEINSKFPNKHIYCLGAAIGMRKGIKKLEKFHMMWLGFLMSQPKRTLNKIHISIQTFIGFLLCGNHNDELNKVLKSFQNDITSSK